MYYILDENKNPVKADAPEWLLNNEDCRVDRTDINEKYVISTVFLGLDHSFNGGLPVLFETMVFNSQAPESERWLELDCQRYYTWDEAKEGHNRMVSKWMKID